jgi:uncharacterized membrane protein (GlpM family)
MSDIVIRFVVGGAVVAIFAIMGDLFEPKSFAGLFGAAPSVALATLLLTIYSKGRSFAVAEAQTMIGGVIALFIYTNCVSYVLMRFRFPAYVISMLFILLWLSVAVGWLLA